MNRKLSSASTAVDENSGSDSRPGSSGANVDSTPRALNDLSMADDGGGGARDGRGNASVQTSLPALALAVPAIPVPMYNKELPTDPAALAEVLQHQRFTEEALDMVGPMSCLCFRFPSAFLH